MSLAEFEYYAPETLDDAIALLVKLGGQARIMAGGTDLLVKISHRVIRPIALINIKKIRHLETIQYDPEKGLAIGATALLADVAKHPAIREHYPAVADAALNTANVQVRNKGTVVGNLCNASPSADNAPALLCLDATVVIVGPQGERRLALVDFFKGPGMTALAQGEIVTEVRVPPPLPHSGVVYQSLSARGKLDCSAVGVAALVAMEGDLCLKARVAIGACAPMPMRAVQTEAVLTGKVLDDGLVQEAARTACRETSPITDLRASADYRWKMVDVLTMRVLLEARRLARR